MKMELPKVVDQKLKMKTENCEDLGLSKFSTRPPNGRRAARPMERVPLPSQIAFLPCTSQSQDMSKARSPIGRENLGHWSNESL
ncbi:hypothetical protein TNCV_26801 [Trichonephila clavipes]|uniref:Uncharacterized protein n=1 Tax=Trichonephila clavipes TaxID=2585209 RepID=A0A8X6WL35_TRICX|nr:hypothetical protein TNCV_26801 [Trichonephila clavipes]